MFRSGPAASGADRIRGSGGPEAAIRRPFRESAAPLVDLEDGHFRRRRLIMQVSGHSRMPCRLRNRLSILVKRAMCAVNGVVSHGRASCGEKSLMSGFGCSSPKIGDRVMRKAALAALLGLSLAATTVAAVQAVAW